MLCSQALKGEPMTVTGDGTQTRSCCFVDDLVDGIFKLCMSNFAEPVNIGNPIEYTVNDFARTIGEVLGTKTSIQYIPARPDDPRRRKPDISRARAELKWEPKVSLQDGLRKTIAAFQDELKSV
jgi:nucleoside-diphosphate-sugar epimerase